MTHNVKVAATPAEARSAVAAESKTFSQRLNRGRTDTVAAVGTVEVTGLPQVLHTRNLGGLDLLFIPLLDSARGILSFIDKMCAAGESREQAISMARIRLASEMLQDPSFTLAPRGMDEDNSYLVDLEKGTLSASARLYAIVQHRTSLFKVRIEGNIAQGPYTVQNTATGAAIMQVDEAQMRQPGYFSTFLPEECLRAHIENEKSNLIGKGVVSQGEVRLVVSVGGKSVPFILRQKRVQSEWDIIDGRSNQWLGVLPDAADDHLTQLMEGLAKLAQGS
jgi:hypothetical protein